MQADGPARCPPPLLPPCTSFLELALPATPIALIVPMMNLNTLTGPLQLLPAHRCPGCHARSTKTKTMTNARTKMRVMYGQRATQGICAKTPTATCCVATTCGCTAAVSAAARAYAEHSRHRYYCVPCGGGNMRTPTPKISLLRMQARCSV